MAIDSSTFAAFLKDYFTDDVIRDVSYPEGKFFASLTKKQVSGENYVVPVKYGNPASVSNTLSDAIDNKDQVRGAKFNITMANKYAVVDIARQLMKQADGKRGSFLDGQKESIEALLKATVNSIDVDLFGNGSGSLGQVATSGISTTTLTLADPRDAAKFEVGMEVVLDDTATGASPRAGSATITAIDRSAGTLETDSNWSAQITSPADGDYIFVEGSANNACEGLLSWLPTTAPASSDSHFGVDRSTDTDRLAGFRADATGLPMDEALRLGLQAAGERGHSPDVIWVHPKRLHDLATTLGNDVQRTDGSDTKFGFRGIKVASEDGEATVMSDRNCPYGYAFALTSEDWHIASHGMCPEIVEEDGSRLFRSSTTDAFEVRVAAYYQLVCSAPGRSGVITL